MPWRLRAGVLHSCLAWPCLLGFEVSFPLQSPPFRAELVRYNLKPESDRPFNGRGASQVRICVQGCGSVGGSNIMFRRLWYHSVHSIPWNNFANSSRGSDWSHSHCFGG